MTEKREREIPAGEFKAKCLGLLDEVATTGHALVVTKRGKPVARIVPYPTRRELREQALAKLRGEGRILGDLLAPDPDWESWDSCRFLEPGPP